MSKSSSRRKSAGATTVQREDPIALFNQANLARSAGRLVDAERGYRDSLRIEPGFITAWNNLGTVLKDLRRTDEAMNCYRRALALKPDYAVAHNNLGVALTETGRHSEAAESCRRAIALEPGYFRAHYNLGKALHEAGRFDEAMSSYRRALAIEPKLAEAHNGLADSLQAVGQIDDCIKHYRCAIELNPANEKTVSSLLFALNFQAGGSPAAMLAEARRYGEAVSARAIPFDTWACDGRPDKRLRVGFVSGDFLNHPVGFFLEGMLAELCNGNVDLIAYSNNARSDSLTLRIKPFFAIWRTVHELDDAALAQRIHDDAIDILVDLSGHTALNRLPVFAWKPAPIQISWLGYFATTGVPGMDYFLGDKHVCPVEEESHFSETVLRLPDAYYCFTPPGVEVQPGPLPAQQSGHVTFGCFNKLAKMGDTVVETWARILAALPDSALFLKSAEFNDDQQRHAVRQRYALHGIAPERLLFEGDTLRKDYLAAYQRVDIALDPFPFPGGTTTVEGLWMGVPALTLQGDRFIGHQGETILANTGLSDWIANDRDDYVAKAIRLAADLEHLARLRDSLRNRLTSSPLCDARRFAGHFADTLRQIWQAWCRDGASRFAPVSGPDAAIDIDIQLQRALAFQQAGHLDEAIRRYRDILAHRPDQSFALSHLGLALCQAERMDEAIPCLRLAIEAAPDNAKAHLYLGLALKQLGQLEAAAESYRRVTELEPGDHLAYNYLGNTLGDLGRHEDAVACFRRAIDLGSDLVQTHTNLANSLHALGQYPAAAAEFERALVLNPDNAIAHNNLGNTLKAMGQTGAALEHYRRAIEITPDYHEAHNNLGVVLREQDRFDAALDSFREALRLCPDFVEAHSNFAGTLQDVGRFDASIAGYARALELDPDNAEIFSNLLFSRNYIAERTPAEMLGEARLYGMRVSARARPYQEWHGTPDRDRKLRIGLVSGDLREHPVGFFLETTLAALDPGRIELHAYLTDGRFDALTHRIRPRFAGWRNLRGIPDEAAARIIHDDAIDILIDLAGHTANNRLPVFSWKPAPVQVAWLGYFATTGVAEIDYLLGDPRVAPPAEEHHFSETLWRLPDAYYCFSPPDEAVMPSILPALDCGRITFGCFNNIAKMNDAVVNLWAEVLRSVPGSRLLLKAKGLNDTSLRETTLSRYGAHDIPADRLLLEGASPRRDYLTAYHRIDIALDPFPYPGGTTTAEALWMGVPVLTLCGDRFIGHQGETLLDNAGLPDWIALDRNEYVAKSVAHAADLPALAALRSRLRPQFLASPLCDADRFARHLEEAFRGMWRVWCDNGQKGLERASD